MLFLYQIIIDLIILSINEGSNAMHVHFHTKKRQQKIVDGNQKADVKKGQQKKEKQKKHGKNILLKGK